MRCPCSTIRKSVDDFAVGKLMKNPSEFFWRLLLDHATFSIALRSSQNLIKKAFLA